HFGVPLVRGMIVTINIRLAAKEIEYIINHCGAKAVFVDAEFAPLVEAIRPNLQNVKLYVSIVDKEFGPPDETPLAGAIDYETFIEHGSPDPIPLPIE